uniref:Protein kinase domain-containing protein n=1 Tax=Heligmosomoides polygyrus TaxID=6339 RepID=A0A183F373_HELPZ
LVKKNSGRAWSAKKVGKMRPKAQDGVGSASTHRSSALVLSRLEHCNIVRLYGMARDGSRLLLVFERMNLVIGNSSFNLIRYYIMESTAVTIANLQMGLLFNPNIAKGLNMSAEILGTSSTKETGTNSDWPEIISRA